MIQDPSPRAVLYRRVSTREQVVSGLGLAAQRSRLRAEAERRAWPHVVLATDEGVGGAVAAEDRPALGPVLASLAPGDVLAVAKLDRLSRSVLDFSRLLARSDAEGWRLVCLDPEIDTTTPNGRLVAHVLMAVAQWERETIAQRVREGLAEAKARGTRLGRRPGLPPVGAAARGPAPVASEVLAAVRDLREAGRSPGAIAERLNAYGHPSPRGGRWHRESVRRLIARESGL